MGICASSNNHKKKSSSDLLEEKLDTIITHKRKSTDPDEKIKKVHTKKLKPSINTVHSEVEEEKKTRSNSTAIAINNNNIVQLSTGTPLDNYKIEEKLGEGAFGAVFRVKHKDIGVDRAMKKLTGKDQKDKEKEKEILNEIEMLKSLDHPNIVKVFEFYNTNDGYYIITEYCKEGELFDRIMESAPFNEAAAAYLMYQILSAVFYCHNLNIIHRDMKPENILIEHEDKETNFFNIKIIDFGTAKITDKSSNENKIVGSTLYIAPEVLKGSYNEKCDVWSVGVIMYICLCGKPPFEGEDDEVIQKIMKGRYDKTSEAWLKLSEEAKDLLKHLLDLNTKTRVTAQKALTHKWFKVNKIKEKFNNIGADKLKQSIENIKKFKSENKLQQAALAFLVHNSLHLPEVKEIVKVFNNFDENGDGRITKDEMTIALRNIYKVQDVEKEVDEIYKNIDNDNNGYIEYEEYIRASINKKTLLTDSILKFTFKYFDKDGSGEITADEITQVLFTGADAKENEQLTRDLLTEINMDVNASITYQDFKKMMFKLLH